MAEKEELSTQEWDRIAATDEFKNLIAAKAKFIVPAVIFFVVYYFALPVLVGFAPKLMETRVFGVINIAYLFEIGRASCRERV